MYDNDNDKKLLLSTNAGVSARWNFSAMLSTAMVINLALNTDSKNSFTYVLKLLQYY